MTETAAARGVRYRAAADRVRQRMPRTAVQLDRMAASAEEEARHEGHSVECRLGGTWCSCGKPLGVSCFDPTPLLDRDGDLSATE